MKLYILRARLINSREAEIDTATTCVSPRCIDSDTISDLGFHIHYDSDMRITYRGEISEQNTTFLNRLGVTA